MTLECIDTRQNEAVMILCAEISRPISTLRLKVQLGLMLFIGCLCLATGLRLLYFPDPIGTMAGLGLMIPIPSCCFFAWSDIRTLEQVRAGASVLSAGRSLASAR
jgi:hypothetical protein